MKDADSLELILTLKEEQDIGNTRAPKWIPLAVKRLKTPEAQQLAVIILETESDEWWFKAKDDSWWVHREGQAGADKRF